MKKRTRKIEVNVNGENPVRTIVFCTQCGAQLDDFTFSEICGDKEKLKENFKNCCETGKFKGDFCSKLFISEFGEDENLS